jgi:uncharacterized membrane protein
MGRIFKRGLIGLAPLALTIALILWLFNALEALFKPPIEAMIGKEHYFPGCGILVALILIFLAGLFINHWLIQRVYKLGESLLNRIPFVKTLYSSIGELMRCFRSKEKRSNEQVVVVEILGMKFVGLVTRDSFSDTPKGLGEEDDIAVYLPMSYQIGGYTVILPRSKVQVIDMTIEEGMRFTVTAGVLLKGKKTDSM